jgi:hypothetical protein
MIVPPKSGLPMLRWAASLESWWYCSSLGFKNKKNHIEMRPSVGGLFYYPGQGRDVAFWPDADLPNVSS